MSLTRTDGQDLRFGEITLNWVPSRTLLYSVILHLELLALIVIGIPWAARFGSRIPLQPDNVIPSDEQISYLPSLEPAGSSGPGLSGKAGDAGGSAGSEAPILLKVARQAIHHGPQTIISNPLKPDNYVQTIRRPDLVAPPRLKAPLQLPNLVLLARSAPSLGPQAIVAPRQAPKALPKRAPEPIAAVPAPSMTLGPSKLTLPPPSAPDVAKPTPAPNPAVEAAAQAKPAPVPPAPPPTVGGGTDDHSLAVLNALNVATQAQVILPAGELHGAFAVSPSADGTLGDPGALAEHRDGSGSGGPSGAPGGAGAGGGTGVSGSGTGKGSGEGMGAGGASGKGPGGGGGNGVGLGSGTGGTGAGKGGGTGPGSGGSGTGSGSGLGSGSGPGRGPFPGITIQGGGSGTGRQGGGTSGQRSRGPARQHSYEMTIVASASSGGGLKDFGVFHDEAVYTVYIGMSDADAPARDWTMQYAVLKAPDPPGDPPASAAPLVVPPFALTKKAPHFPAEAAAQNAGRMIVLSAIINAEGKLEKVHLIQSPNPTLTVALLEALDKWEFRPAEVNGSRVPVKVLLGIPITAE